MLKSSILSKIQGYNIEHVYVSEFLSAHACMHTDQFFGFSNINAPVSDQLLFYGFLPKAKHVFKHTYYVPELVELSPANPFFYLLKMSFAKIGVIVSSKVL